MKPLLILLLGFGGVAVVSFLLFRASAVPVMPAGANVTVVNGQQIVEINVKGGYQPQTSEAKAGLPTTLRFKTNSTFDCSSIIRIPSLGISKTLPSTGTTDIAVGSLAAGTLQGTCGMGMYRFTVRVQG